MARRANGVDLSDAIIIVDYIAIKNISSLRMFRLACPDHCIYFNQGVDYAC
jgi:hypothetical protein